MQLQASIKVGNILPGRNPRDLVGTLLDIDRRHRACLPIFAVDEAIPLGPASTFDVALRRQGLRQGRPILDAIVVRDQQHGLAGGAARRRA